MIRFVLVTMFVLYSTVARPHEFWIEAEDYTIKPGDRLVAHLRLGQNFKGTAYSFNPARFERFELATDGTVRPVGSRMGDKPAVVEVIKGSAVLVHRSTVDRVFYARLADFIEFAEKEGLENAAERHATRGLPDEKFREAYFRNAKALVRVGEAPVSDRAFGLPLELVVLGKPAETAEVQLLYGGEPLANAQVSVFAKQPGDAKADTRRTVRTDASGRATIELEPDRIWLLNAVHLREPAPDLADTRGVVWETLWASTTFATD